MLAATDPSDATKKAWTPWKTAQHAVSHSVHTRRPIESRQKKTERRAEQLDVRFTYPHTEFLTLPLSGVVICPFHAR